MKPIDNSPDRRESLLQYTIETDSPLERFRVSTQFYGLFMFGKSKPCWQHETENRRVYAEPAD